MRSRAIGVVGAGAGRSPRGVLYVDRDRFYFSVAATERHELDGDSRPVNIGHDPREFRRDIVTTANDPARALGMGFR